MGGAAWGSEPGGRGGGRTALVWGGRPPLVGAADPADPRNRGRILDHRPPRSAPRRLRARGDGLGKAGIRRAAGTDRGRRLGSELNNHSAPAPEHVLLSSYTEIPVHCAMAYQLKSAFPW